MSSQGPAIVHYEVYALEAERWTLHARFRKEEREDALEEAKAVETTLGHCAKVVRETYYPGDNSSEDALVYKTDKKFKPRVRATGHRARAFARGETNTDIATPDFRKRKKVKAGETSVGVLLKLFLVVGTSLAIACGVAAIVNNFLIKLPQYGMVISDGSSSLLMFVTFVAAFLASAVPFALSLFDWRGNKDRRGKTTEAAPQQAPPPAAAPLPEAPPAPVAAPTVVAQPFEAEDTAKEEKAESDKEKVVEEKPPEPEAVTAKPEEAKKEAEQVAAEPKAAPENEVAPPPAEPAKDHAPEADASAGPLEPFKMMMIRLLSGLLGEIQKVRPSLDAYNLFGIDLVLAGAIDVLGTEKLLSLEDKRGILKQTIEVMGTKSDTAKAFADKYEDYLVEPKYLSMVQVGRNNMEALLADAEMSLDEIGSVFTSWNRPQPTTQTSPGTITVLFTDMVGSTDLTQSRGDHAAQDIVRRHNSIVRSALAEFAGKEIKHTGDGIMASFSSAANGVEAAIAIQKACAAHNEKSPNLPLHLRIGINAGEPIQEEDDLFGTTVQLSARVCAKAASNEILCTNVVRELSAGKDLTFDAKGVHELKGFKDAVPLFAVQWTTPVAETEPAVPAPAPTKAAGKKAAKPKARHAASRVAPEREPPQVS
ncbi:adenylate/guanylate cyclase domain-containing protein [Telmatospirillum sp.]|uniref:adenylate/guanylate cyclase domain-containing protein n=1 Tax=Telmatospirillum sp. TaxID=2079197 RepID=UPI00284E2BF3|nr:adenylate/guanylate cyclase domain-containing protein [Telmatospirillum sp.]MDR3438002.1 adenylate/guanylate cyclase domain-containing protein [Telmatospirillum sp.]